MTTRNEREQWLREVKSALMTRIAGRAMTRSETGLDGLAKSLLKRTGEEVTHDPELDHPEDWDRPID
ncbi:MAG: hypothetical protein AAGC67_06720 [Myxococcota bacterium]